MYVSINKQLLTFSKLLQPSVSALTEKRGKDTFSHYKLGNMPHESYGLSGIHLDKRKSSNS